MPVQKDTKSGMDSKLIKHNYSSLSDFYVNADDED